jgi:hypothetical protein
VADVLSGLEKTPLQRPASGLRKHPVLLLALLALLLTAATGTGLLLHAQGYGPAPSAAQRNVPFSNPGVKPPASLTPGASIYPPLAASYTGAIADLMTSETANLLLTDIQQNQEVMHGSFQGLGLVGPFKGMVTLKVYAGEMTLVFEGNIKIGGDMAGSFAVDGAGGSACQAGDGDLDV